MSSRQRAQFVGDARANRGKRLSGEIVIEEIGRLDQLRVRIRPVGVQDAILHVAVGADEDQQHAPLREAQELEMAEARLTALGRHHDTGELRELRQQARRGAHELPRPVGRQLAFEPMNLTILERLHHHQAVDEKAVAFLGRYSAGGRVRARNEAHLFQVSHDIAHGRRRQLEAGMTRQCPRADRLAVAHIAFDQRLEEVLRARIQHGANSTAVRRGGGE